MIAPNFFKRGLTFLSSLLLSHSSLADGKYLYKVKKNEILSQILKNHELIPIYGLQGSLSKTIQLNSALEKAKGNFIFPGQNIILPLEIRQLAQVKNTDNLEKPAASEPYVKDQTNAEKNQINQQEKAEDFGLLSLSLGTGFISNESKDNFSLNGVTDTQSYYFTQLSFKQFWNSIDLVSDFKLGFHSIHLSPPSVEFHSKADFNKISFGLEFDKKIFYDLSLILGLNYNPIYYIYSRTGNTMNMDAAQLGFADLGLKKKIIEYKKLSSTVGVTGSLVIPKKEAKIDFKSGWGLGVHLQNEYRNKNWAFTGNASAQKNRIKTQIQNMEQTVLTVSLGLGYYLD